MASGADFSPRLVANLRPGTLLKGEFVGSPAPGFSSRIRLLSIFYRDSPLFMDQSFSICRKLYRRKVLDVFGGLHQTLAQSIATSSQAVSSGLDAGGESLRGAAIHRRGPKRLLPA